MTRTDYTKITPVWPPPELKDGFCPRCFVNKLSVADVGICGSCAFVPATEHLGRPLTHGPVLADRHSNGAPRVYCACGACATWRGLCSVCNRTAYRLNRAAINARCAAKKRAAQ